MDQRVRRFNSITSALALTACLAQTACTPSPSGNVSEIVTTHPPTFSGQASMLFRTPTTSYEIKGECDPISYAIEYSYDKTTWTHLLDGCPNSAFSLTVTLTRERFVYFRAKTKFSYTTLATADVRLTLPPTSPSLLFVSAGNADDEQPLGTQFGLDGITKATMTNGTVTVKTSLVDTIYEH